jgi:hypothetical protein
VSLYFHRPVQNIRIYLESLQETVIKCVHILLLIFMFINMSEYLH